MGYPRITVVMTVFNGERFLSRAIESVLRQTYTDFEFLIVDDASTDKTNEIARLYNDPRIAILHNETNRGPGYSRNMAIRKAAGEYIAVLDSDDEALPMRLARQIEFLDANPEVALYGSAHEIIDENGKTLGIQRRPTTPALIRWTLLSSNCITSSSVMFRKECIKAVGGYDEKESRIAAEDFSLWGRVANSFTILQTNEVLVKYRINCEGLVRQNVRSGTLRNKTIDVVRENVKMLLGKDIPIEVAKCLHSGEAAQSHTIVRDSYEILWECFNKIFTSDRVWSVEKEQLLKLFLNDALRIAGYAVMNRVQGARVASRISKFYGKKILLSWPYLLFILKLCLIRKQARSK
jgi:glycosyltransferase involved in cell wall biosynthesis